MADQGTRWALAARAGLLLALSACSKEPQGIAPASIVAAPETAPASSSAAASASASASAAASASATASAAASASASPITVASKQNRIYRREPEPQRDCCAGKNECKGQSGCKSAKSTANNACSGGMNAHACAGQNMCKGTGTSCPPGSGGSP